MVNWMSSPIWGFTGKLYGRQSRDVEEAKAKRLEKEGKVDEGPEKHTQEGHADRKDLLAWGNKTTAEAMRERRNVVEEMEHRPPSPLKRRTSKDFEEVYKAENEIARRRTLDLESEMLFEKAMEKARLKREREAERKRREQERYEEMWTPKDITMRDSGIGQTQNVSGVDGERLRKGSEEGRPGDELPNTYERLGDVGPVGISRPEMETEIKGMEELHQEVAKTARRASIAVEISDIKRSRSILDVHEQSRQVAKAERQHMIQNINQMEDISRARGRANTTASHPMVATKVRGGSKKMVPIVDGVVQAHVQDHQAHLATPEAQAIINDVEPPPPLNIKREVPQQVHVEEHKVEVPPRSPNRSLSGPQADQAAPKKLTQSTGGTAVRGVEDVSPTSLTGNVPSDQAAANMLTQSTGGTAVRGVDDVSPISLTENVPSNVHISEVEVQKSIAPELREEKWTQGNAGNGGAAEERPKIPRRSPSGGVDGGRMEGPVNGAQAIAAESLVSLPEIAQHDAGSGGGNKPVDISIPDHHSASRGGNDDSGIVKKPVGIPIPIPKSVSKSESKHEENDLGKAKEGSVKEKWVKGTEGEEARMDGNVSPKSVRVGSAVMSVAAYGHSDLEEGYITKEEADKEFKEQNAAQRRTEKWVKGSEGEETRMEGNVSPKSARVGSAVMSLDGGAEGVGTGSVGLRSARSQHGEESEREEIDENTKLVENVEEQLANGPGGLAGLEIGENKRGDSVGKQVANGPGGLARFEVDEDKRVESVEDEVANGPGGLAGSEMDGSQM